MNVKTAGIASANFSEVKEKSYKSKVNKVKR